MIPFFQGRRGHCLLLTAVWAALCLVNLGGPSLWDIDEGNNAQCAREMYEADNWIIPTFNYEFRVDKPAMLYWLQMAGYHVFGVGEFAARLPSALAALACILLVCELGRRMFGEGAGLIAGLMLASSLLFCGAAHFANPDALLCAFTLLTMLLFWRGYEGGGDRWLIAAGVSTGWAMLTKGPVGLVLPAAVVGLFLLWMRQLGRVFRPALAWGLLAFALIAAPWYIWVSLDTRGVFFRGFFLQHNVGRFMAPMESHSGPFYYYLLVPLVGCAPWSVFFALTAWHIRRHLGECKGDPRYRFLACWIGVYLVFFSLARTKLPNYILPVYPALALIVGHFLDRWRKGEFSLPAWGLPVTLGGLALTGALAVAGPIVGGSAGESLLRGRHVPGLEMAAILGLPPLAGALAIWRLAKAQRRDAMLATFAAMAVCWLAPLAAWGVLPVEGRKAPRELGEALNKDGGNEDMRVATWDYFQPSLVFYAGRRVEKLLNPEHVVATLRRPVASYVVLPVAWWERLQPQFPEGREVVRRRDLYRGVDVVLVSNR